jgi:hypothetical protein
MPRAVYPPGYAAIPRVSRTSVMLSEGCRAYQAQAHREQAHPPGCVEQQRGAPGYAATPRVSRTSVRLSEGCRAYKAQAPSGAGVPLSGRPVTWIVGRVSSPDPRLYGATRRLFVHIITGGNAPARFTRGVTRRTSLGSVHPGGMPPYVSTNTHHTVLLAWIIPSTVCVFNEIILESSFTFGRGAA